MLDDFVCDYTAEDSYKYFVLDEDMIEWNLLNQMGVECEAYED